jgi:small redox-active disulfide protein 2
LPLFEYIEIDPKETFMLTIKILGSGCTNCKKLESVAREAVKDANLEAEFVKVTDMKDILAYDLMSTPGLVINEKLVSSGRIPTVSDVQKWLQD